MIGLGFDTGRADGHWRPADRLPVPDFAHTAHVTIAGVGEIHRPALLF